MAEQTFRVGDKVTHQYCGTVEVTYGPYKDSMGEIRYMMRFSGEAEQPVSPSMLTPLPAFAVGDKVTSTAAFAGVTGNLAAGPFASAFGGSPFWVMEVDGVHQAPVENSLTKVTEPADTFEYNGVTYKRSTAYMDDDGDYWEFSHSASDADGTPMMRHVDPHGTHGSFRYNDESLSSIVSSYGPLTKHTA